MAADAGIDVEVVLYLKTKPDAAELASIIDKLEGPVTEMVRRDATFAELGLTDADVETPEQVIAVLVETPKLLQRPILIRGDRAVVGRPKQRIADLLGGSA